MFKERGATKYVLCMHCKELVSYIVQWKIMEQSKFPNTLTLIQVTKKKGFTETSKYVLVS